MSKKIQLKSIRQLKSGKIKKNDNILVIIDSKLPRGKFILNINDHHFKVNSFLECEEELCQYVVTNLNEQLKLSDFKKDLPVYVIKEKEFKKEQMVPKRVTDKSKPPENYGKR